MLRFVVEDYGKTSRNDFVGQYTLPLSCTQQGKDKDTLVLNPQILKNLYELYNNLFLLSKTVTRLTSH